MSELRCSRTYLWSTIVGLISASVMLMTAAVVRVIIEHVMVLVETDLEVEKNLDGSLSCRF